MKISFCFSLNLMPELLRISKVLWYKIYSSDIMLWWNTRKMFWEIKDMCELKEILVN